MRTKYIDHQFPSNYHIDNVNNNLSSSQLAKNQTYQGKNYQLLGTSEKTYTFKDRAWIGTRAFIKTALSLGFGVFFSETIRDDWNSFWSGKRTVALYTSSPFLAKQVLAHQGDKEVVYDLAVMAEKGIECQKNMKLAFHYYQQAADNGNLNAQKKLAQFFEHGISDSGFELKKDVVKALKYYDHLAAQGDLNAQFIVGHMYIHHQKDGIEPNHALALQYLLPLAKNNHKEAQFEIGMLYFNGGFGIKQNYIKAMSYFKPLAEEGHKEAQLKVGFMYFYGQLGIKRNEAEALQYLQPLADEGNPKAQYYTGVIYFDGTGIQKDEVKALQYLKTALSSPDLPPHLKEIATARVAELEKD